MPLWPRSFRDWIDPARFGGTALSEFLPALGNRFGAVPRCPGMNALIEEYLRSRGVRYFRGHHDDEFFFLVDFLSDAHRIRLNVHLEVCGSGRDAVRISVSPDRFYPADRRERLTAVAARWNAADPCVHAVVHDSSDPALVGVSTGITRLPGDLAGLTDVVDRAVTSSLEVFALLRAAAVGDSPDAAVLRDAG